MVHLTEAELQSWLDGELVPAERTRVSRHLEDCAECRRGLSELRAAAATFSAAMLQYDEDLAAGDGARPTSVPAATPMIGPASRWPKRLSRAAAVVLLLGGAAAAAVVPGSPFRALFTRPAAPVVEPASPEAASPLPAAERGASITVRPFEDRLTVRITGFAPGTRIRLRLADRVDAVASLPDGATNARFIVASGTLEVVGSSEAAGPAEGGPIELRMPRSLGAGVIEIDGAVVARVSEGRLITLRQVSRTGDEAVLEVGG